MSRRNTPQQQAIRTAIESAGRPLSVQEIHELASEGAPGLGLRTVYRVVNRLLDDGVIAPVIVPGQQDRYELAQIAAKHHHHFRCEQCDRVFDVHACPAGLQKLVPDGFVMTDHTIVLHGRCAECV